MDYKIGFKLIDHALEESVENKLWDKWLTLYPNMTSDNFMSFDDFKEEHKPKQKLNKDDKKRIDDKVNKVKEAYRKAVKN